MAVRRATVHDVAKLAGTSATTVSRVLSKNGYPVSEKLKNKVINAVKKLKYSPNLLAKSLKENTSRDIGVIIPTVTNPFYSGVILGIEKEANKNNYNIFLCNTLRDHKRELMYIQTLFEKQVKGIILSSVGKSTLLCNELIKQGVNFVLLDQKLPDVKCSYVGFNIQVGAVIGVEYLLKCGHTKIAFASTPLNRWTRQKVFQGYKQTLKKAKLEYNDKYILISKDEIEHEEEGYEVYAGRLMGKKFVEEGLDATAVLMINDMMAFGFIQEINKQGINVPGDVSIIGFDDIPFARLFSPALTTISYPPFNTGKLAAKLLFEKINVESNFALNITLEPKLIVRDSVKIIN